MMNEKIRNLRHVLGLSQTDFAKRLSVSRSAVCKMESGENSPSEQTLKLICKEFSVNETWLRTGTGDMFLQENKDAQISQMLDEVIKANESDFKRRLISALSKLDDDGWDCLEKLVENITATDKEK